MLVLTFGVFIIFSLNNFIKLLECNDELMVLIETQRVSNENTISQWETAYDELESDYGSLLIEKKQLEIKLNEVELPTYEYTEEEIYMLAQCVEAEAGYYEGHELSQKYVTQVILNRVMSGRFPNTIEEVIYQGSSEYPQFAVAYNGMMNREPQPETLANVYSVIVNGTDLPEDVLFFHSASVCGNCSNSSSTYAIVEGTAFTYSAQ